MIRIVSPFNTKAKLWIDGRKNIFINLKNSIDKKDNIAWFHASSLGEFEQGRPVIEEFKKTYPNFKILLTFFSPSGYEIQKDYKYADYIFYLPADSKNNAKKFIEIVSPKIAFFVKYDFWFHYLSQLNRNNIPTFIFSAIFRKNQLFFKWYGFWYRKMLTLFTRIYVQDKDSKKLLNNIKINNVEIGGDTRFDRVYNLAQSAKPIKLIEEFSKKNITIIAGSTWEKDEDIIAKYINNNENREINWIIAPHEVHSNHIEKIIKIIERPVLKFSKADKTNIQDFNVIIIDSIGILSSLYRYGNIAYIGGGFGAGIHNTLEAATYGLPVIFGPNYKRFKEACDLIKIKSGFTIANYDNFKKILEHLIYDETIRTKSGESAKNYIKNMCGGTSKILSQLSVLQLHKINNK
jgi:3-deoxy-D-manno-octulosonic-acid transferase